ncbi:MAG: hypothetical protein ACTSPR_07960, partial [Candidatus Thorarchaeota archaeon]
RTGTALWSILSEPDFVTYKRLRGQSRLIEVSNSHPELASGGLCIWATSQEEEDCQEPMEHAF